MTASTALVLISEVPAAHEVLAMLGEIAAACTPADVAGCYSDLHKSDYGVRPYTGGDTFSMALWLARRPRRACGYQDPAEYEADLAWLAECEAADAAEEAAWSAQCAANDDLARLDAEIGPDWDVDAGGRVRLYA